MNYALQWLWLATALHVMLTLLYLLATYIANYRLILYLTTPTCPLSNWWNLSHLQGKRLYFWEVHGSHSPMFVTRSWFSATLYEGIWWFWTRGAMGTKWLIHTCTQTRAQIIQHTPHPVQILVCRAISSIYVLVYLCTYTHTLVTELQGTLSTMKKWSACVSHRGNHSTSSREKSL